MKVKKKPNGYWTKERILLEALKHDRPSLFQKLSKGAYLAALRADILDEVCSHMTIKTYWTNEMLLEEALKHESRASFRKNHPTAYTLAHDRGILDKICSHMSYLLTYWNKSNILKVALECETLADFRFKYSGAYHAAVRMKILDEVCSHMPILRTYWTDKMLHQEALKYRTRTEFQNANESAYQTALNRKIIDKICSHMKHSSRFSLPEEEILNFIKYFYPNALGNSKKIIPPLELDIFVPELNLAIEYCGLYWHSGRSKENNYHFKKMKMCNEKNIRLITIFEDEWLERQDQVKGYLKSVLNKNEIRIFARKTDLKQVEKEEAKHFLNDNHIQGSVNFEIAFGLYFNKELIAVTTGGAHHRQGHEKIFVLNRLAFKSNISIAGGSSRLLKQLMGYAKEKGFEKLLSWSDNRFSEGRVYESIGFILEGEHGPDYSYVKGQTRISKQSCQKKNLLKKGAKGTMANTEKELALTLGLHRIYDCGKKAWSIDLTK